MLQRSQEFLNIIAGMDSSIINKSFSTGTGLVNYNLERPAKLLFPVRSPLRNILSRKNVMRNGGDRVYWKSILTLDPTRINPGVNEGLRTGSIVNNVVERSAIFKTLGKENSVTFEAFQASLGFQNDPGIRELSTLTALSALMEGEEFTILGGNTSFPLGITPAPLAVANATGGTLPAATYSVVCVALSFDGKVYSSVNTGVRQTITRANNDGTTTITNAGSAAKSPATAPVVVVANGSISVSVTPVRGAVAYAWYWGAAGNELLGAITPTNSYLITALATGTQTAASLDTLDHSINPLVYDGYLTQLADPAFGSYYRALPTGPIGTGTPLTSTGGGGIVEIDEALQWFFDNYTVSPTHIFVNARDRAAISKLITTNDGNPLIRYNIDANKPNVDMSANALVINYVNPIFSTGRGIQITTHPFMPQGTLMFYSDQMPNEYYARINERFPSRMLVQKEYTQTNWPVTTRTYFNGIYTTEVLAIYFPGIFGLITNIGGYNV